MLARNIFFNAMRLSDSRFFKGLIAFHYEIVMKYATHLEPGVKNALIN